MKQLILGLFMVKMIMVYGQHADTLSYKEIQNLSYVPSEEIIVDSLQRLNLVIPKGVNQPPLLLWIGGGAWSFVDRNVEMDLARKFAREGIAVASVGHLLSKGTFATDTRNTGVKHPAHIHDIAAAFRWIKDHSEDYGYDSQNIFVGGFSSGAHLTALLGMDPTYLEKYNLNLSDVKGIIPIAGTYDIHHYYSVFANHENPDTRRLADTHVKDVFGDSTNFTDASPVTYLEYLQIPMLLISERGLYDYTKVFEERIRESGFQDCQILHVFNFDHSGLWKDISHAPNSQTRNIMIDFIQRHSDS